MRNMRWKYQKQRGGVSLFVVMFTALIVTVITVSFTQIMIRNSQQALDNDLAQRAYDSAMAGVEDAKRLLIIDRDCNVQNQQNIPDSDPRRIREKAACDKYSKAIRGDATDPKTKCSTIVDAGIVPTGGTTGNSTKEVRVGNDEDNQAYTCVKIDTQPDDVKFTLAEGGRKVAHLKAKENFHFISIRWFKSPNDFAAGSYTVNCPGGPGAIESVCAFNFANSSLPSSIAWNKGNTPPIVRAQYIPFIASEDDSNQQYVRTAFLYPGRNNQGVEMGPQNRRDPLSTFIYSASCSSANHASGACEATLSVQPTSEAYLVLEPIYNKSDFVIQLKDAAGGVVKTDGVQPVVDSTGRADNLFRRVKANVELEPTAIPYPAAINLKGDLCKAFFITNDAFNEEAPCRTSPSSAKN